MGFQHGEGSEKLLVCQKCNATFELDANFCTECRAPRMEALGGKVSRSVQESPAESTSIEIAEEAAFVPAPKKVKNPKIRPAIFNFFNSLDSIIKSRKKLVYITSAIIAVLGSYFLIQTLIFMSSTPDSLAQRYVKAVAARDASLVSKDSDLFPNPQNLPLLPVEYQSWRATEGLSWRVSSQWNGWFGNGELTITPVDGEKQKYDDSFTTKVKATYKSKLLVFRTPIWRIADEMAAVDIKFGTGKNIGIILNQVPAGSVGASTLKETKYAVFPGELTFQLQGAGFTKPREAKLKIGSAGVQPVTFPEVEYELGSARESDAKSQLVERFVACLKKRCSSLPRLSDYDFDFSNQPDSYMYTDYFIISWGDDPSCDIATSRASSADSGYVRLSCSVYASASVKWMLYRVFFTTYYDTGYDSKEFTFDVSADVSRTSSPYRVSISNFSISS